MGDKRYLLDYEVEAHACLIGTIKDVHSKHPDGNYQLYINNLNVKLGVDRPLLSVKIIISAETINDAIRVGGNFLSEYLHILSFATNNTFKIHKLIRVIDWSIGITKRDCIHYKSLPNANLPHAVLESENFKSVEYLLEAKINRTLKRALMWYSNGVSTRFPELQFQNFWFVIELLSKIYKKTEKVNDSCPKCNSKLYCESCKEYPLHRPYPKQSIKSLMKQFCSNKPDKFFENIDKVRNGLFHGEEISSIEQSIGDPLSKVVDKLGNVAWKVIFDTFKESYETQPDYKFCFLKTNSFTHKTLRASANMTVSSIDPYDPKISELPKVDLSIIIGEKKDED